MGEPNKEYNRPSTAGVHITEHPPGKINPSPVSYDETEHLIEEYLSPRKLKALTGVDDLSEVKYLEMRVDTSETSLGNFGSLLPNLSQLKLNNSIIFSVRDLGSSFPVLRILWMARCNLEDLDGVTAMTSLKELYLAYNEISDLSPLSMMDKLEILDLEGNNINDISQVEFLSLCTSLRNLTLDGNPICVTPQPDQCTQDGYDYRQVLIKAMPQLQVLDDIPTTGANAVTHSNFDTDWDFLQELEKDGTIGSLDSVEEQAEAVSTPIRPTTGYRPGTSLRPTSAQKRLGTGRIIGTAAPQRPSTSQRPISSDSGTCVDQPTDASQLTTGELVCGNPSKALRARKKRSTHIHQMSNTDDAFSRFKHHPEHSYPTDSSDRYQDESDSLWEELKEWRLHHESVHKKLEESRAPNVLTIEHDEDSHIRVDDEVIESDSSDDQENEEDQGFVSRQEIQPSDEEVPQSPSTQEQDTIKLLQSSGVMSARRRRYKISNTSTAHADEPAVPLGRPVSGPAPLTASYRVPMNKSQLTPPPQPVKQPIIMRADIHSPEKIVFDRSSKTAKAAMFTNPASFRQNKPKIPSLPSRPTVPK